MNEKSRSGLSRRSFIKWTSAIAAMAGLPISRGLQAKASASASALPVKKEAIWKPVACWHNCGGRCLNKALVVDGVVERQKTDDLTTDTPDFPQQRGCLRGRSQRKQVFGADRLKYPMKRKGWAPGGGDKSLRGRDQWVRISWDEALDILASETKRIRDKYSNESIWATGSNASYQNVFSKFGGYTGDWGTTSWGAWYETAGYMGLFEGYNTFGTNDRFDLRKSQLIVLWGANPAWSSPGNPTYNFLQAKNAGARFISIDPSYTASAELLDAEWYPVNPGSDHALALAIMHTLLEEDDPKTNPLIDWDFLRRCTVGFEKETMPEGVDGKDNFKDYLLGTYTNEPKTAEWASKICGLPPEHIRKLARQIGGTQRAALLTGWGVARIHNGEGWVQSFSTLGFMTGHMGRPGRMTGVNCHFASSNNGPRLLMHGNTGAPGFKNPITNSINHNELNRALLEKKYRQRGVGDRDINIQMIFHTFNATMQTRANIAQAVEAYRKDIEFVVTPAYVLTTNAKYSDLVLPITTEWEREGTILRPSNREVLLVGVNVTKPLYEAKSDQWIAYELAKRLDLDADEIFPLSEKQQFFNTLLGATIVAEDGKTIKPLITITEQDITQWKVTGEPQQGYITLNDFLTEGKYQIERKKGDNYDYVAYEDFVRDPTNNPRPTRSGKFEIHCQKITDESNQLGWTEVSPTPVYVPVSKGIEDTYEDFAAGKKGEYPFQVYNPHYLRRSHSTLDNVEWLREAWPSPVYINAQDAKNLSIKHGDTILITSELGKVLRPAYVTQTMKPGVLGLPHGSWANFDEKTGIDVAGADNTLTVQVPTGLGTSGWNTSCCKVEKWHGEQLVEDVKLPQRIIFNEA